MTEETELIRTASARKKLDEAVIRLERHRDVAPIRIALLRPPWVTLLNSGYLMPTPPVGLGYIAAVLRDAGHQVQVVDAPAEAMDRAQEFAIGAGTIRRIGLPPQEVIDQVHPDTRLIGITNMFAHEWPTVRELAGRTAAVPRPRPSSSGAKMPQLCGSGYVEQTNAIDAAVLGEGEATAVELAAHVSAGLNLAGMEGIALHTNDETESDSGLPVRFRKLDHIPQPAWDLFPLEAYFEHKGATGVDHGRSMPILATHGCPYKCSFCSSPNMWTTRYTVREPSDVVDEIEHLANTYDVRNVDFVDLTPMTKRSWIIALSDELEHRNLDVSLQLPIGTRSEALDPEVLTRLAAGGTTNITFAPETGSPHTTRSTTSGSILIIFWTPFARHEMPGW